MSKLPGITYCFQAHLPLDAVWQLRHDVLYPEKEIAFVHLKGDNQALHFGISHAGRLVSTVSVFEKDGTVQFRKLATDPSERGRGLASYLLKAVFDYAAEQGCSQVWCNARVNAVRLYEKFGMEPAGERWSANGYDYTIMKKTIA
ncbi:MAG: GNAT family N-acetyltransferase [Flavihumibacter sp.]